MRRLFAEIVDMASGKGRITGAELDHLRVLRLHAGDAVVVFDRAGMEHEATIESCTGRAAEVRIIRSYRPERESFLELTLAQCLGKGEKMDWVVEKAVELGAREILPVLSDRTVPRLDAEKIARRRSRWEKIALGAAKQCGRTSVPGIGDVMPLAEFIRRPWPHELKLMFWEGASSKGLMGIKAVSPARRSVLLLIGPEGGFAESEVRESLENGFETVGLGRRILRTETAAVAALAVVQLLWGDMG